LLIEAPRGDSLSAMNEAFRTARRCRCERPVLDGEGCLLCGRPLISLPEPSVARRPEGKALDWTRAGVIRALRAFAFFRGRAPVPADWSGRMGDDWPRLETVLGLFGSVEAAIQVAGIESRPVRQTRAAGA
jgi:hypothetical protein